jgi:phosphoribosylamine--glycine ligase
MGSFTPPVFWNPQLAEEVSRTIMEPIIGAMAQQGAPYRGMLYAGLMFTQSGPRVLEFNCRFGDPETQVILPLLESDPIEVMTACIEGNLSQTQVCWGAQAHLGVVMVSGGYPGPYATGLEITGLNEEDSDTIVFQAGTQLTADNGGRVVTSGGRVLTVVGRGDSLPQAREAAYRRAEQIHFQNAYYRRDIGDLSTGCRKGV